MRKEMKKRALLFAGITAAFACGAGCIAVFAKDAKKKTKTEDDSTFVIYEDKEFGGVNLIDAVEGLKKMGAEFGDSLDVVFSNGYEMDDVPYYNGYYERVNRPLVCAYPGCDVSIMLCSGDPLWTVADCREGETVTFALNEKGKYNAQQEAMDSTYVDEREAYDSDEQFSNFREMSGGDLKEDTFYRGASPVNNQHKRASCTDSLLRETGIQFILDLADTDEKIAGYMSADDFASDYAAALYADGKLAPLGLNASYRSDDFKRKLADGLRRMCEQNGPYYIHCTEGKDRTGFVCLLLEGLAGASYEEIEADYMKTYDEYYGITEESDPEKYEALKVLRLHDMLWWLADLEDDTDMTGMNFTENAKEYLKDAGMNDQEILKLTEVLTGRSEL